MSEELLLPEALSEPDENGNAELRLPDSGTIVTLRTRISYREGKDIEKTTMSCSENAVIGGEMSQRFNPDFSVKFTQKLFDVFIVSCVNSDGEKVRIKQLIDGDLSMKDGDLLENTVSAIYAFLKKR